jgi:uroporphyrinogen-III synthase
VRAAIRWSPVWVIAPSGHASTHAAQKMQRPRSSVTPFWARGMIACVGQTPAHSLQRSAHFEDSTRREPPCLSGSAAGAPLG